MNLDPHDLDEVLVHSRQSFARDGGAYVLHITADASGAIHVWLPPRFRTPDHEARAEEEEKMIRAALVKTSATTPKGAAVRVTFQFGNVPN